MCDGAEVLIVGHDRFAAVQQSGDRVRHVDGVREGAQFTLQESAFFSRREREDLQRQPEDLVQRALTECGARRKIGRVAEGKQVDLMQRIERRGGGELPCGDFGYELRVLV
jgi:hypothetical protein